MNKKRTCKMCGNELKGRSDQIFCTPNCKAIYHHKLKQVTREATYLTDKILHRNRSILLELIGKNKKQIKVSTQTLTQKNFKRDYMTGIYETPQGKRYYILYDLAWSEFINGEVLIIRRNT